MSPHAPRGVALVLAAAALWGTTGTAQSFAPPQLSPYWVGAWRLVVAAAFFALLRAWPTRADPVGLAPAPLDRRRIALAALCMGAYNLAFFAGVRACGVALGTAIALGSGPIWAGLLQASLGGQRLRPGWWLGAGVAVAGVVAMSRGGAVADGGGPSALGVALCLLAGLSYAVYALVNQRLVAHCAPARVTAWVFSGAALLAVPGAWLLAGPTTLTGRDAAIVTWLGVASTGVAYLLFSHALRHISGATGVVLALAEPVTAFVLAVVVVGEHPGLPGALGLLGVLAGLVLVVRAELAAPAPAPHP